MDKEKREPGKSRNKAGSKHKSPIGFGLLHHPYFQKVFILTVFSVVVASLLKPSFVVDAPLYRLGDVASQNFKAKRDFLIEDKEATARKREEALRQSPILYDYDADVAKQIQERLADAFQRMRRMQSEPSAPTQLERLTLGEPEPQSPVMQGEASQALLRRKQEFETAVGFPVSEQVFSILVKKRFNEALEERVSRLIGEVMERGILSDKEPAHRAGAERVVIRKEGTREELWNTHNPLQHMEEARQLVRMKALEYGEDSRELMVTVFLVTHLLKPNLIFNREETERRRELAYWSVKPVYVEVMKNEMLVREGQRIGAEEILKFKAHGQGKPYGRHVLIFITLCLVSALCMWVFVYVATRHFRTSRMEIKDFLFLGVVLVFLLALGRFTLLLSDMIGGASAHFSGRTLIYALPMTAGAMIASIFFGVTLSLMFSLLLSLFAGMLFGKDFAIFFYFLIGSLVAAHCVFPCRNRIVPIKAGFLVGCGNVVLILLHVLLQGQWEGLSAVIDAFSGFLGGVLAGILVTGFTPLAELVFGYHTDIKLLELVTMDQPLLQELMVQAPGTYHHSIIVSNMVEAAAQSIGANALLAKVAACYHDIGKIRKPMYFIENQFDCENRHEKLAPSMSSLILISHIKEGVELAKQNRLGKAVIDIISQHHGKSLISFFYKKAMEAREKARTSKGSELPPINVDDYRYPGPKPQTKEAGLVMLADVVEAACRSLNDPTPARIQGMVNRLINAVFSDGQLDECELTLKDLHHIAKHFNQILATVHHKRIEYPTVVVNGARGKADAPDSNLREAKPNRDKPPTPQEGSRTDLKRLGMQ